jgi:hypothetical protein
MPLITTEDYVAERRLITAAAARWRSMSPVQRRDHIGFDAGRRVREAAEGNRAAGPARAPRARAGGALLLDFNATSLSRTDCGSQRPLREKLLINRDAQRCKRMKVGVSNAARLIHRQAHQERHCQRWNLKFITLTYADPRGWRAKHIASFVNAVVMWCRRNGVRARFVWVAELQKRGAVHYHMVLWLPKGKFLPPYEVGSNHRWWPHGFMHMQTAQSPVGYLVKYASKANAASASQFPQGARMFGHGGLSKEGREEVRYWRSPIWVRDALPGTADIRKVSGGYVDKHTGEFLASPWRVYVGPGGEVWAYRVDQQEEI